MDRRQAGFTLLEVMIAMSILAIGAASILGIFVAAVKWQSQRVEDNRITEIYNHALQHAEVHFNNFDPTRVAKGQQTLPSAIEYDFDKPEKGLESPDPLVREAYEKFPGFRYQVEFHQNDMAVRGSSVMIYIKIYGLSRQLVESDLKMKQILTRSGTPIHEFWSTPSKDRQAQERQEEGRSG